MFTILHVFVPCANLISGNVVLTKSCTKILVGTNSQLYILLVPYNMMFKIRGQMIWKPMNTLYECSYLCDQGNSCEQKENWRRQNTEGLVSQDLCSLKSYRLLLINNVFWFCAGGLLNEISGYVSRFSIWPTGLFSWINWINSLLFLIMWNMWQYVEYVAIMWNMLAIQRS